MKIRVLIFTSAISVVVAMIVYSWWNANNSLGGPESNIELPPPLELPVTSSSITVPVRIPLNLIGALLDDSVPYSFSSDPEVQEDELDATVSWQLTRSDISLAGRDDLLHGNATLTGRARLTGYAGPVEISEEVTMRGQVTLALRPTLHEDWVLLPQDLTLDYNLSEADIDVSITRLVTRPAIELINVVVGWIPFFGDKIKQVARQTEEIIEDVTTIPISVRSLAREYLDEEIAQLERTLRETVFELNDLQNIAESSWNHLCGFFPLENELWIEASPLQFRVSQLNIEEDTIVAHLGLDVQTRVVSEVTQNQCPFNAVLDIEQLQPGSFEFALPAELDYGWFKELLAQQVVGLTFGDSISIGINDVSVQPDRSALLATLDVTVRSNEGIRFNGESEVHAWFIPTLLADGSAIILEDVRLDALSRDFLLAVLGEIGEPLIANALEGYRIDLGPTYDWIESEAVKFLRSFASNEIDVEGELEEVFIESLQIGPTHIQLVGKARGSLVMDVQLAP